MILGQVVSCCSATLQVLWLSVGWASDVGLLGCSRVVCCCRWLYAEPLLL